MFSGKHESCGSRILCTKSFPEDSTLEFPKAYAHAVLTDKHLDYISKLYSQTYPQCLHILQPNSVHKKYKSMHLNGKHFQGTGESSTQVISLAYWDEAVFGSPPTPLNVGCLRTCGALSPIKIHYFAIINLSCEEEVSELPIAVCSWYLPHPETNKVGKPVQAWCPEFEQPDYYCFIPIEYVKYRCSYVKTSTELQIIPLVE